MNPNLEYAQAVLGVNDRAGHRHHRHADMPAARRCAASARRRAGLDRRATRRHGGVVPRVSHVAVREQEWKGGARRRRTTTARSTTSRSRRSRCSSATARSRERRSARAAKNRIASQIDADGKQQRELDRTRPLHYSLFNLDAFTMLAEMGRHVGVDLWRYTAPNGGSLEKALLLRRAIRGPAGQVSDAGHRRARTRRIRHAVADARLLNLATAPFSRAIERIAADAPDQGSRRLSTFRSSHSRRRRFDRAADQLAAHGNGARSRERISAFHGRWQWISARATEWTSGFFAGMLW